MHLDQIDALLNTSCESCNRNKEEKTVRHTTIKNYTYGMATGLCVQCEDCNQEIYDIPPAPSSLHGTSFKGTPSKRRNNSWFELNLRLVLATLAIGNGGSDLSDFCAFLDLPQSTSFGSKTFNKLECVIGQHLRDAAEQGMADALEEEIRLTLEKEGKNYDEWKNKKIEEREIVELTVSYDMGWQKRSSGNRYDSLSGHAFMVGAESRKIIHCVVTSKMCATCLSAELKGTMAQEHLCPKNYTGSSKAMESDAAVESYYSLYRQSEGKIVLGRIIADDDSSMRAMLRHQSTSKKGVLPDTIPEPSWLSDPSHRIKVVAKPFYGLAMQPKSISECSKVDAGRIKKWFSYMLYENRTKTIEEMRRAAKCVVEHLFNIHTYCNVKWCKPLRLQKLKEQETTLPLPLADGPAVLAGQDYLPHHPSSPTPPAEPISTTPHAEFPAVIAGQDFRPHHPSSPTPPAGLQSKSYEYKDPASAKENWQKPGYYRSVTENKKLYKQITKIYNELTSDDRLKECLHSYDTQLNEAMNTSVSRYARKGRTYCTTMSLTNRVMIAMGVRNEGFHGFWSRVFDSLQLPMSVSLANHLRTKDRRKGTKRKYESTTERKLKRAKVKNEKFQEQIKKQIEEKKRGATYGAGIALTTISNLPSFVLEDERKLKKNKNQYCAFVGCLGTNHKTAASKRCVYHHCTTKRDMISSMRKYLKNKYNDRYGEYFLLLEISKK